MLYLSFDDALDRADRGALRGVIVTNAFHTGLRIDDVNRGILGDRVGGAFGQARAASNAIVQNFHSHKIILHREN